MVGKNLPGYSKYATFECFAVEVNGKALTAACVCIHGICDLDQVCCICACDAKSDLYSTMSDCRNDELIQLRRDDLEFGCKGPAPYFENHFKIHLSNRKGWQRKLDNDEVDSHRTYLSCFCIHMLKHNVGNVFGIYDQPNKHPINCFYHMQAYINFLEAYYYKLEPNDFIFPAMSPNGTIQRGEHITAAVVQIFIDEAVDMSGIEISSKTRFSTHCFRRGGAQYRFIHAPFGERWPLDWIRWWGGWAEKESVRTSVKPI